MSRWRIRFGAWLVAIATATALMLPSSKAAPARKFGSGGFRGNGGFQGFGGGGYSGFGGFQGYNSGGNFRGYGGGGFPGYNSGGGFPGYSSGGSPGYNNGGFQGFNG